MKPRQTLLLLLMAWLCNALYAQEPGVRLKGTVLTEKGEALTGVTIDIRSASTKERQTTTSDDKGVFQFSGLNSRYRYNLSFSFVGYETHYLTSVELSSTIEKSILVRLKQSSSDLDQVVVVGYGSQQKRFVTGASSHVQSQELNKYASSDFASQLAGKAAGVVINSYSAQPGTDPQIVIRGIGTLTAGRSPLVVVDGFPLSEGSSINSINPEDIETVDILKDPGSAAIYGSRSANGVILITTKKGKQDKNQIAVDFFTGIQERADKLKFVGAYDAALYFTEARDWAYISKNPAGRSITDDRATRVAKGASLRELRFNYIQPWLDKQPGLNNTDWLDQTFRKAPMTGVNLAFSGGSAKMNHYISLNYLDQQGIVIENDFRRFSGTIKVDGKLSDRAEFGINLNPSYGTRHYFEDDANSSTDPIGMAGLMYPFFKPYNNDGTLAISQQVIANTPEDGALAENPVAAAKMITSIRTSLRLFGNSYVSYSLLKGLKFKTMVGGDLNSSYSNIYNPSDLGGYRTVAPKPATAREINGNVSNYITENTLTYAKQFGAHDVNVLAGYTFQKEFGSSSQIDGSGIPDNNITNIAGASAFVAKTSKYRWTQISYLARIQYGYAGKYLLSATARRDGSSRFGNESKWANFPSLTAGWLFSKENFFSKNNVITFAKLRATWGKAGNNQIGSYGSRSLVSGGSAYNYVYGSTLASGFAATTTPNPNLSWETKVSTNIGADISLFNKINISTDYYITNTENLLLDVPVPEQSGFSTSTQNIGKVRNQGFEIEVSGNNIRLGKVSWHFAGNFATNKNRVIALAPGQTQIIAGTESNFYTKVGGSVAELYGYHITGLFKTQAEVDNSPRLAGTLVGDYIVQDMNGDGKIDSKDMIPMGTYNPKYTYGFSSEFSYKHFDVSFAVAGVAGRKIYDISLSSTYEAGEGFAVPTQYYFENRYHPVDNPNGFLGQPNNGNFSAARRAVRSSDISFKDAGYLRLRTLQLAYNIPSEWFRKKWFSGIKVYASANNLFTITKFNGYNPDATADAVLTNGQANINYPVARTYLVGLNINL